MLCERHGLPRGFSPTHDGRWNNVGSCFDDGDRCQDAGHELANILIVDCPTTRNQGAVYDDSQQQAKEAYEELVLPTVRRSPRIPEAYAAQKVLRFYDPATENPSNLTEVSALSATDDYYLVTQALGFKRR